MLGDLPPSSSVTRLSARPALAPISRPTDRRAGEGDLVDVVVVDQRRAGLAVAGDHVQHALGQARLERQLAEAQRRERRLLGRLEHDRAAGRQRRRDLPRRHQQREVPGDDLPAHADRLLARVAVHVRLGDRQRLAGDLGRPAGEVAQVLGGERHVHAPGELDRLAVVERLELAPARRRSPRARRPAPASRACAWPRRCRSSGRRRTPRARRARRGRRPRRRRAATSAIGRPVAGSSVSNVRPSAASGRSPPISSRCGPAANARAASERASGRAEAVVMPGAKC